MGLKRTIQERIDNLTTGNVEIGPFHPSKNFALGSVEQGHGSTSRKIYGKYIYISRSHFCKIDSHVTYPNELAQTPADGSATCQSANKPPFQSFHFPTSTGSTSFNLPSYEEDVLPYRNPTSKNCLNQVDQRNLVLLVRLLLLADSKKLKLNLNLFSCNNFKIKKEDAKKNKYNISRKKSKK